MTVAEAKTYRFTRAEYYQMAAMGFFTDKRVELIGGEVLEMPPQTNPHALTIMILNNYLIRHLGDEYLVRCQLPLTVTDYHEPEPDFAILRGRLEELKDHPKTALMVIEVAYETLRRDRKKAAIYAQAGVEEYWIIDLKAREITQHTDPRPASTETAAKYATVRAFTVNQTISSTVLPLPPRLVETLLPPY